MTADHAGFPSDETLAAYIEGRLDADTRGRVSEHLASCSECYSVFIGATEMPLARAADNPNVPPSRAMQYAIAAIAAAAAAIGFFVTPAGQRLYRPAGLAALAGAAPSARAFSGRLSGFPYREPAADPSLNSTNPKLIDVAARVQENAIKSPTADNLHALGVSQLLLGNANEAVSTLAGALRQSGGADTSTDVALLSDYSAALSTRARQTGSANDDAALAARAAQRAWSLRRSPETAWNRAVAIGSDSAWNDYLMLDASSDWAREARARLAR